MSQDPPKYKSKIEPWVNDQLQWLLISNDVFELLNWRNITKINITIAIKAKTCLQHSIDKVRNKGYKIQLI